jgi:hypothetical protein
MVAAEGLFTYESIVSLRQLSDMLSCRLHDAYNLVEQSNGDISNEGKSKICLSRLIRNPTFVK